MPECVGNYLIPSANFNVEGADTLEVAGILNFLNIYVQQTPISAFIILLILGFSVKCFQLHINDFYGNCQFAGLLADVIGIMYCRVLKETKFKISLTLHLLSRRTGLGK
jgi:hypothetical protein